MGYNARLQGLESRQGEAHDALAVGYFRTLAMGTNFAVETAKHCHSALFRRATLNPKPQTGMFTSQRTSGLLPSTA